jgi:hypothetical protein
MKRVCKLDPIAQLFLSRNAHFEKHRLYDLKTQLSPLPQFGHSKIRSSIPSSSGDMRAKLIGVEHFGQPGRKIVRGIEPYFRHRAALLLQAGAVSTLSHRRLTKVRCR